MHMRFGKGMVRAHTRRVKGKTVFVPAHRRIDHGTLPRARMKNSANMATTPEELASRFGPESERFQLRDKDDKPLLVRKFGRGKNHAFAVHDADGSHIATMHVKTNKDGAHVSGAWTHDRHSRRGVHNALLHRLVAHHGNVTSPTSMHHDLHHAFNTMDDDHELATERTEGGGGVRYRLQRKQATLFKGVRVRLRKAWFGDSERHSEAAKKGHEGRRGTKAGFWDLRPKATIGEAMHEVRRLYVSGRERAQVFNPDDPGNPLELRFSKRGVHHAVTRDPDNVRQLDRKLSRAEREDMRVFDPDRAARVHWIGRVLAHPEAVYEATDSRGRTGYLMWGIPETDEPPYVVFVQPTEGRPGIVNFVTAYSYTKSEDMREGLRLGRQLYPLLGDGNPENNTPQLLKALRGRRIAAPPPGNQRGLSPAGRHLCPEGTSSPGWALGELNSPGIIVPTTAASNNPFARIAKSFADP